MAFIPDMAVDSMSEISPGAWKLYCFLARCRNQKTGKCCPSINVTMEIIGTKRSQIYQFRKELVRAGWATFDGNNVLSLFGFHNPKSRTTDNDNKDVTGNSPGFRNIPESRTVQSEISDDLSGIPDSTVRNPGLLYKEEPAKEPANRTSKEIHVMSGAVAPTVPSLVLEVFNYWQAAMNHPQAKLTPERKKKIKARLNQGYTVAQIQTAIDGCRASPFHMGQNDSGTVYDDLTLICRSGEKLESFIEKTRANGRTDTMDKLTPNAQKTVAALESWLKRGEKSEKT